MNDWNADRYDRFADERSRASYDLISAINHPAPQLIVDLGCGSGLSTAILAQRWPRVELHGVDNSPAMLAKCKERVPSARLLEADISEYQPGQAIDVLVANAALQWLGNHGELLPKLMSMLAPGGSLAVQMPNNLDQPSHRLMREVAQRAAYNPYMSSALKARETLLSSGAYYDVLCAQGAKVQLWETHYRHVLDAPEAIADWFRSTGLKPYLDALPDEARESYLQAYCDALKGQYPRQADGNVLLIMPRLFFVAQRRP
ncbi:MAG: trans-aconitate 2-methyltransferase [Pseudomonadota bacterium]